jgi:hypothetical protein
MSDTPTAAGAPRPRTLAECRAELAFKRDTLIANIKAAEAGQRGGGRSRGVQLDTPQKAAAWFSWGGGIYVDADYALPQLRPLFLELRVLHKLDVPSWQGEPQTDVTALQMLDDYLAACDRAIGHAPNTKTRRSGAPQKYPRCMEMAIRLLAEGEDKDIAIYRKCKKAHGAEEPIPDKIESFMRAVRREAAKRRGQA